MNEIDKAIKLLFDYMKEKYKSSVSEDGPYIQITPRRVELVDAYGQVVSSGLPEDVSRDIDVLD